MGLANIIYSNTTLRTATILERITVFIKRTQNNRVLMKTGSRLLVRPYLALSKSDR